MCISVSYNSIFEGPFNDLGLILSTFYEQLSRSQIWKAQKNGNLPVFLALLGSALVKAACRTLMKLTPDRHLIKQHIMFFFVFETDCRIANLSFKVFVNIARILFS